MSDLSPLLSPAQDMPDKTVPITSRTRRIKYVLLSLLSGLLAGLLAALLSVLCMFTLRQVAGVATPVELFGDFVLKHISVYRFIDMLSFFSRTPESKAAPLGLALLGMIAAGIVLGPLYALLVYLRLPVSGLRPTRREWLMMLLVGAALALTGIILFRDELAQNFLGLPPIWARLTTALAMLLDFAVYALALGWSYRLFLPRVREQGADQAIRNRRTLLARTGTVALGAGAAAGSLALIHTLLDHYTTYDGMKSYGPGGVTPPITPNDLHYVVTQNPIDPTPSLQVWRLEVAGLLNSPASYTYEEFIALPSVSRAITLECIANGLGDHLISTAIWQGINLNTLLERLGGVQESARYIVFSSVDGYSVCLPVKEVMDADALLAFRMNGVELPMRHGYPLRVLIPGRYGEENPKWVTRIELTDHVVGGLYADQGWYNGEVHTITRIDRPLGKVALHPSVEIAGLSFAGRRGIQRVEVSTDNGQSWHDATLAPALSKDSWVLWSYLWQPAGPGRYTLVARATDGSGQVQTSKAQGTVPGGATGYHRVGVTLV